MNSSTHRRQGLRESPTIGNTQLQFAARTSFKTERAIRAVHAHSVDPTLSRFEKATRWPNDFVLRRIELQHTYVIWHDAKREGPRRSLPAPQGRHGLPVGTAKHSLLERNVG